MKELIEVDKSKEAVLRREMLLNLLNKTHISDIDIPKIAKELNVNEKTIRFDIKTLVHQLPQTNIDTTSIKLSQMLSDALKRSDELMHDDDPSVAAKGIKLVIETQQALTTFLEQYGYKEKVADKIDVTSKSIVINISGLEEYPTFKPIDDDKQSTDPDIEL